MYCGILDLMTRWIYTRQGLHKLIKSKDFPASVFTINNGKTKVWLLSDIEVYERDHPEVTDESAKEKKRFGYARAVKKGNRKEK